MPQEDSDLIAFNEAFNEAGEPFATEHATESGHEYTCFDAAHPLRLSQPPSEMLPRPEEDVRSQTSEEIGSGQISQTSCNISLCPGTSSIVCQDA